MSDDVILRPGTPEDAAACGKICFEAFTAISNAHNFPPDFPNAEIATGFLSMLLQHPEIHVVVAERDGRVVGSNAIDLRSQIAGIGPITVEPGGQNGGVGRLLMTHVMDLAASRGFIGVRLVQAAFHCRSLSLYTKLGFEPREPLSCVQGAPLNQKFDGYDVRLAIPDDLAACNRLCLQVHGHTRAGEVRDAISYGKAEVVEHLGRITGYTTGVGFMDHTVGETVNDLKALIAAAPVFAGPGMLVPTRNGELLRWCLGNGLRITQPLTLMSTGLYNEPRGAFLPSILF